MVSFKECISGGPHSPICYERVQGLAAGREMVYECSIIFIFVHGGCSVKVSNSIKTLRKRHKACRVVSRRGRLYVINKINPRFKARQG